MASGVETMDRNRQFIVTGKKDKEETCPAYLLT